MRYLDGLATTLASAAVPYGYSLMVWSSGALATQHHGSPRTGDVASFAGGAVAAYVLLRLATRHREVEQPLGLVGDGLLITGAIHLASLAASVLVAAYASAIGGELGWALSPFAGTGVYLLGTALAETVVVARRSGA